MVDPEVASVKDAVRKSLQLLSSRDKRLLALATGMQMMTSLLDLFGVLLIGVVAGLSVSSMTGSAPPEPLSKVVDAIGLDEWPLSTAVLTLGVLAAGLLMSKTLISIFLTRRLLRFLANRQALVSGRLIRQLLQLPFNQVQQRSSQQISFALTTGVNFSTLVILGLLVTILSESALLIVLGLGLLGLDPVVTIASAVYFTIVAVILHLLTSSWAGRLGREGSSAEISSLVTVQELLFSYRELFVSGKLHRYEDAFQGLRWKAAAVQSDLQFMGMVPKFVFEVALVGGGLLLATSQFYFKDQAAAVATIGIFLAAGSRIVPAVLRLQGAAIGIRGAAGGAIPTLELAAELEVATNSFGFVKASGDARVSGNEGRSGLLNPTVSLVDVSAKYPGATAPALRSLDLAISPGESIAIAGATGSGKSTLADVILGVMPTISGSVRIGGYSPVDAISGWPGQIAYVPQSVGMVNGSVRQNVALGEQPCDIDDERVWEALRRARLDGFLQECRDGLDTEIGEQGITLSGGQRQRLGIARALYTDPKLVVLDEATSALDAETERAIMETLSELAGRVTTVIIAHRLATVTECDRILYLKNGEIVAAGSFEAVRRLVPDFDRQAALLGL